MLKPKMAYASSKESLKLALNGIAAEIQANDDGDDGTAEESIDAPRGRRRRGFTVRRLLTAVLLLLLLLLLTPRVVLGGLQKRRRLG